VLRFAIFTRIAPHKLDRAVKLRHSQLQRLGCSRAYLLSLTHTGPGFKGGREGRERGERGARETREGRERGERGEERIINLSRGQRTNLHCPRQPCLASPVQLFNHTFVERPVAKCVVKR
jgi:hypothetical protein